MKSKKINIPWSNPVFGKAEMLHIQESFQSQRFTMGKKVKEFERCMAKYLNVKYAIAINNGTIALDLALKTIGIKSGDEVIMPAISYFSSASSISYQNAIPVFVDVNPNDINIDTKKIVQAITKKTKAILYIDYGGGHSDIKKIHLIAKKYNLKVVQDAAQSLGGRYKNKPLGANSEISTMSFHMAKIITTIEGGMIFTNNKKYYEDLIVRRNIGEIINKKYYHSILGTNARMTEINAGIGLAQLKKLNLFVKNRNKIAKIYDKAFSKHGSDIVIREKSLNGSTNSYFFYPIMINNRNIIAKNLKEIYGIDTRVAYPMPLYKQPFYLKKIGKCKKFVCKNSEKISSKILNIPIYPEMTSDDVNIVIKAIISEVNKYKL
jgi:perosamine synthetase